MTSSTNTVFGLYFCKKRYINLKLGMLDAQVCFPPFCTFLKKMKIWDFGKSYIKVQFFILGSKKTCFGKSEITIRNNFIFCVFGAIYLSCFEVLFLVIFQTSIFDPKLHDLGLLKSPGGRGLIVSKINPFYFEIAQCAFHGILES